MRSKKKTRGSSVEVWIELSIQYGHAELKVGSLFWGFWPDESVSRRKVPQSTKNPKNNPNIKSAFGGYYGRLSSRGEYEFLHEYTDRLHAEAPLHGRKIPFHRFVLRGPVELAACVRKFLREAKKSGVEYDILNRKNGLNCVGLAIEALKSCGSLNKTFELLDQKHSPAALKEELLRLSEEDPEIDYEIKWLNPPRFT